MMPMTKAHAARLISEHGGLSLRDALAMLTVAPEPIGLRDEFAASALPAIIGRRPMGCAVHADELADACYNIADAMMRRRSITP